MFKNILKFVTNLNWHGGDIFSLDRQPATKVKPYCLTQIVENNMTAQIVPTSDNRFNLTTRQGVVATYARARDAKRGALRRGLELA